MFPLVSVYPPLWPSVIERNTKSWQGCNDKNCFSLPTSLRMDQEARTVCGMGAVRMAINRLSDEAFRLTMGRVCTLVLEIRIGHLQVHLAARGNTTKRDHTTIMGMTTGTARSTVSTTM
jgi:hypothetical protein